MQLLKTKIDVFHSFSFIFIMLMCVRTNSSQSIHVDYSSVRQVYFKSSVNWF